MGEFEFRPLSVRPRMIDDKSLGSDRRVAEGFNAVEAECSGCGTRRWFHNRGGTGRPLRGEMTELAGAVDVRCVECGATGRIRGRELLRLAKPLT